MGNNLTLDEIIQKLNESQKEAHDAMLKLSSYSSDEAAKKRGEISAKDIRRRDKIVAENADTMADYFKEHGRELTADYIRTFKDFSPLCDILLDLPSKTNSHKIHPLIVLMQMYNGEQTDYDSKELSDLTGLNKRDLTICLDMTEDMCLIKSEWGKRAKDNKPVWSKVYSLDSDAADSLALLERKDKGGPGSINSYLKRHESYSAGNRPQSS